MTLVICPKCTKDYKYPSVLLKHLKSSSRCLTSNEEIKSYFENHKNVKISKKKIISCNILCNWHYHAKVSMRILSFL